MVEQTNETPQQTIPHVQPTCYNVSLLPEDHTDAHVFALEVEYRGRGQWAVTWMRDCLSADGEWDFEPNPSSRDDGWLGRHRFDLETALELARQYAPQVTVNGIRAADVARWARPRRQTRQQKPTTAPSATDILGVAPDWTGGACVDCYVRWQRDKELEHDECHRVLEGGS